MGTTRVWLLDRWLEVDEGALRVRLVPTRWPSAVSAVAMLAVPLGLLTKADALSLRGWALAGVYLVAAVVFAGLAVAPGNRPVEVDLARGRPPPRRPRDPAGGRRSAL